MCNARNHWSGCTCGFGGDTGGGGYSGVISRRWKIDDTDSPLTFNTTCWWCDQPVFFYRNEYGGCALFDRLGWPWQLHSCWEEHREQQVYQKMRVRAALENADYDGTGYTVAGELVAAPRKEGAVVDVQGFIADLAVSETSYAGDIEIDANAPDWTQIQLATGDDELYPFWLPSSWTELLHAYDQVRLKGKWLRQDGEPVLFASHMEVRSWNSRRKLTRGIAALGNEVLTCSYCGIRLYGDRDWGFDPKLRVECTTCCRMRCLVAPKSLVRVCRIITEKNWEA